MAFDVGSVVAHIKADVSNFKQGIQTAQDEVSGLSGKVVAAAGVIKTGLLVATAAAAAGLVVMGKSALDAAANFEQTKISFETMLGSAEKATKLLKDLQEFAKKTPFNLVELQEGTKRLLAYGIEGDKVIDTMKVLGDITSGVGRDKMPQLILAFGQVKAAGHLTGMELRQFSETGVPLLQTLADQFKVTTGQMTEMISAGDVGFDAVQQALGSMTQEGGKFFNLMDKQSKTFSGSMSNLQDSWTQFLVVLGTIFIPIGTQAIQMLTALLAPIVQIVQTSTSWTEALTRMGVDVTAFQAVITEFTTFLNVYLLPAVALVVATFLANWQFLSLQFKGIWDIIIGIVQVAWSIVYGVLKVGLALLVGDHDAAWKAIVELVQGAWDGLKRIFDGIISFISGWGGQLFDRLTEPFRRAWSEIQNIVNKIKDAMDFTKRHSPSVVDIVNRGVNEVNKALSGLQFNTSLTKEAAAVAVSNGGESTRINSISVSLDGAIIADEAGANHMAELLGDRIIKILQGGVRF